MLDLVCGHGRSMRQQYSYTSLCCHVRLTVRTHYIPEAWAIVFCEFIKPWPTPISSEIHATKGLGPKSELCPLHLTSYRFVTPGLYGQASVSATNRLACYIPPFPFCCFVLEPVPYFDNIARP